MDAAKMDYLKDQIAEITADQLYSPASPIRDGIHDEPLIYPGIGDEYQVAIPPLETESEYSTLEGCLTTTFSILDVDHHVGVGLAIPIMWIHHEDDGTKAEQDLANHCKEHDESTSKESISLEDKMSHGTPQRMLNATKGYSPLPGSPSSSWSDDETQSFLLGLYIFGKDLVQVKEFIECKKMEDILAFYYGRFYKSEAYRRWSELRKTKRRCILGYRIFSGQRQQELLSRVLPKIPKDAQDSILKATKILNEARDSLEEFVYTLKKTIGMHALVEAIGIGKGKHDLTGILDPLRSNQSSSTCSEIPVGKACSSLGTEEIIKFLTGDFRLSKAKSNDLFWEAIWPRLLARGWHSEQPISFKNSLVFLIPGIEKFSRKRLVKCYHYFDSVTDVLNKVASDPSLLELEAEEATGNNNSRDENGCVKNTKSVQNGLLDRQHHSYLRPRVPIGNSELLKFTIVDTSLCEGEEHLKVRELRSLPADAFSSYDFITHPGEIGNDSSDDSSSEDQGHSDSDSSNSKKAKLNSKEIVGKAVHSTLSDNALTSSITTLPLNGHIFSSQCFDQETNSNINYRTKFEQQSYLAPIAKRRRLAACKDDRISHHDYSFSQRHQLIEEGAQPNLGGMEQSKVIVAEPERDPCAEVHVNMKTSTSSDKVDNYVSKGECCSYPTTTVETTISDETAQLQTFIDLNLPPNFSMDYEKGEHLDSELAGSQHDPNEEAMNPAEGNQQHDDSGETENITGALGDQQPSSSNSRRQSTRKRPPTARALESLACGFLGTKRKGRGPTVRQ